MRIKVLTHNDTINYILPMGVVGLVGVIVLVFGLVVSVAKGVDVNDDNNVSVVVAMVPVDVGKVDAGSVLVRQPLASIKRTHGHKRIDSFIIELKIAL